MNRKARRVLALISVILFCTFLSLEFIIMEPWDLFPQIQEEYNASDLTDEHLQPGANPEGARLPATRSGRPSLKKGGRSSPATSSWKPRCPPCPPPPAGPFRRTA